MSISVNSVNHIKLSKSVHFTLNPNRYGKAYINIQTQILKGNILFYQTLKLKTLVHNEIARTCKQHGQKHESHAKSRTK